MTLALRRFAHRPARLLVLAGLLFPLSLRAARPPGQDVALTSTPTPTATDTPAPPDDPPTEPSDPTPTATETPTPTDTAEAAGPTTTPSETPPPPGPTPAEPGALRINEVAWSGTLASTADEWIELFNPGGEAVDLAGWTLTDGGDVVIALRGVIAPGGFLLLERTDDTTVADLPADQIYTGALSNDGEALRLLDPTGALVDTANAAGGAWPAGGGLTRASMERLAAPDAPWAWATFGGPPGPAHDAAGGLVHGSPRAPNLGPAPLPSATPSPSPSPASPGSILINEVAWSGTLASAADEWIELFNPGAESIEITGWTLTDGNDLAVTLRGVVPAGGFFLLERTDDTTIADLPADQIYSGGLSNNGETLRLLDASGARIDTANAAGGRWPAGGGGASMERRAPDDRPGSWGTFTGFGGVGRDASGRAIRGTPRSANSVLFPVPAYWARGRVVINEVLIRPRYDWEGAGGVTTGDEFIELYNLGPGEVFLRGWRLDDIAEGGSRPHALPGITLPPGGYAVFFRTRTRLALNDGGDSVRLLTPDGRLVDEVTYRRVRAYNLSYGRLPDGSGRLVYGLWPTPGRANLLFVEPTPPPPPPPASPDCPQGGWPHPRLERHARFPWQARQLAALGLAVCR